MITTSTFHLRLLPAMLWLAFSLPVAATSQTQLFFELASDGIDRAQLYSFEETSEGDLLAGTGNGIWRLYTGTNRWVPSGFTRETYVIKRLASGSLLAGTDRGIYRSTDNGKTWLQRFNIPGTGDFGVMEDGTIVAVDRTGSSGGRNFYYRSTDNGGTWESVEVRFGTGKGTNVVGIGNYLFSGSLNGVKVSYNKGDLWETTNLTAPVTALVVTSSGVLVAAAGNEVGQNRIYESSDTGRTWHFADSLPISIEPIRGGITGISAGKSGEYYVSVEERVKEGESETWNGVWRREPGKTAWDRVAPLPGSMNFRLSTPWISSGFEAMISNGEGKGWTKKSTGLHNFAVTHLVSAPDGTIYALVPERIQANWPNPHLVKHSLFRSTSNASAWEIVADNLSGEALLIDEFGYIYAQRDTVVEIPTSQGVAEVPGYVAITSHNRGEGWERLGTGFLRSIHSENSGGIAVRVSKELGLGFDILYSSDSGRTWQNLRQPGNPWESSTLDATSALPIAGGRLLLTVAQDDESTQEDERGLYRIKVNTAIEVEQLSDSMIADDLLLLPNNDLLAATRILTKQPDPLTDLLHDPGVYRSTDGGESWEIDYLGNAGTTFVYLDEELIFLSPLFSKDGGENWKNISPTYQKFVRTNEGIVYGYTPGLNFQLLDVENVLWRPVLTTGFSSSLMSAASTSATDDLFVGTSAEGIYRSTIRSSSVEQRDDTRLSTITLRVRLAPDRETASVTFTTEEAGEVELTMYDMLGREVVTLLDEYQNAGNHRMEIPLNNFPRGNYLISVRTVHSVTSTIISLP
ncbi:MAG: T9SS type A sorting domain-containing protein [Candidatus Kapaibacterium sp.]